MNPDRLVTKAVELFPTLERAEKHLMVEVLDQLYPNQSFLDSIRSFVKQFGELTIPKLIELLPKESSKMGAPTAGEAATVSANPAERSAAQGPHGSSQ